MFLIPDMLMLAVACGTDVFGDTQCPLMLFHSRCFDVQTCRPVAGLALDILHMRCFFHTHKAAWLTISSGMARHTIRIVFLASHFQDAEVSGVLPLRICLHVFWVTVFAFLHSHIIWLFLCFFSKGTGDLRLHTDSKKSDNNTENGLIIDKALHGYTSWLRRMDRDCDRFLLMVLLAPKTARNWVS
jgi:hypothetical protein